MYSMHAVCHAVVFRSCKVLSSLSPVIEIYHYRGRSCVHTTLMTFYHNESLELWGRGPANFS